MPQTDHILDEIHRHKIGICDSCLQRITGVPQHQTVNRICREQKAKGTIMRDKSQNRNCTVCNKANILNRVK